IAIGKPPIATLNEKNRMMSARPLLRQNRLRPDQADASQNSKMRYPPHREGKSTIAVAIVKAVSTAIRIATVVSKILRERVGIAHLTIPSSKQHKSGRAGYPPPVRSFLDSGTKAGIAGGRRRANRRHVLIISLS